MTIVIAPLWQPSPDRIADSNLTRFIALVNEQCGTTIDDYAALYKWSVKDPVAFWPLLWRFCGVKANREWDSVLIDGDKMPGARWFEGSRLNFAENLLSRRDEETAIIFYGENGDRRALTYAELYRAVAGVAAALRAHGIVPGDRIAGFLPNIPESIVAMLATTSIGAIWSSCSPDFGINGVLDRFGQIAPRILFTADGYLYNGKRIDSLARVAEVAREIESIERIVIVPFLDSVPDISELPAAELIDGFSKDDDEIDFEALPFDHPVYVMYSSGTTGIPKCIVHGAGGTLLQHLKEHQIHSDLKAGERLFYFTSCGWMMWNWLVSGLASGATVVLFDGSPFHPDPGALWRMAEAERVNVFGTSAKYLAAVQKAGFEPGSRIDLSALRAILSTGSPLAPESFDFVYQHIKADLQLSSISGGTDIMACFAIGNPILPVYRGELQCLPLGMQTEIFDEAGNSVRGHKGELVCTAPFPSMPVGFWNDPDGKKYHSAYFDRFPNTWCHGDYAELTEHGGMIIFGRSDAVLNPGGVRIGTAEIYRQVEKLDDVVESIAIGQNWKDDVRVVLFVRLREGITLDDELQQRIRKVIRENTTPRHVPAKIIAVADIPRTISGKIVELAVRKVIHGEAVENTDALANPEALENFRNISELSAD